VVRNEGEPSLGKSKLKVIVLGNQPVKSAALQWLPLGTRQKGASAPEALANAISERRASAAKATTLWLRVRRG
jgi:hypothetical protein